MVVQRDEQATMLNIPDLDDSIPSANNSDRDGKTTARYHCIVGWYHVTSGKMLTKREGAISLKILF